MRWLRLGLGLFVAVQAFQHHDMFAGFVAAFFLFQVVTNTGCCGSSGCTIPQKSTPSQKDETVTFDEVLKNK